MRQAILAAVVLSLPTAVGAQNVSPALAGVSFLVGNWQAGQGQVGDTGGTATGRSTITLEAGGNVLLRKDHTDLANASGTPTGGFEQVMMIYPEGDTLHAEYSDGQHIIHYTRADVVAGRSVTFSSAALPNAPSFRLKYELTSPRTLSVTFLMATPGSADFHSIATGTLTKGM